MLRKKSLLLFVNSFENFKNHWFVWSNNFTYDNNFIFHLQSHVLASLLQKMMLQLQKMYKICLKMCRFHILFFFCGCSPLSTVLQAFS